MDIIYRFDLDRPFISQPPLDAAAARRVLEEGNRVFAQLAAECASNHVASRIIECDPEELGLPCKHGKAPKQVPFAVVLSCSDARVPTELIFNQACNALFVIRVAGNVLGDECLGSIDYAVHHLSESLKVLLVLGHSGCGAVTAAVDSYLSPGDYSEIAFTHSLRSIVDRIFVAVRGAATALERVGSSGITARPDYRDVLIETSVCLNAALTAYSLRRELDWVGNTAIKALYGVYDLVSRHVRLPLGIRDHPREDVLLAEAPASADDFVELSERFARNILARGRVLPAEQRSLESDCACVS